MFLQCFHNAPTLTQTHRHSIPGRYIPNIILSDILYVLALHAGKEWLLDFNIGVFWLVMRVLACGGLGVLIWEGLTGQVKKRRTISIEVSVPGIILGRSS